MWEKLGCGKICFIITFTMLLSIAVRAGTNDTTRLLQQGLFEEDANQNYAAAAQASRALSPNSILIVCSPPPRSSGSRKPAGDKVKPMKQRLFITVLYTRVPDNVDLAKLSQQQAGVTGAINGVANTSTLTKDVGYLKKLSPIEQRIFVQQNHLSPNIDFLTERTICGSIEACRTRA